MLCVPRSVVVCRVTWRPSWNWSHCLTGKGSRPRMGLGLGYSFPVFWVSSQLRLVFSLCPWQIYIFLLSCTISSLCFILFLLIDLPAHSVFLHSDGNPVACVLIILQFQISPFPFQSCIVTSLPCLTPGWVVQFCFDLFEYGNYNHCKVLPGKSSSGLCE